MATNLILGLLNGRGLIEFLREGDAAVMVLVLSFSVVGALIVSNRPEVCGVDLGPGARPDPDLPTPPIPQRTPAVARLVAWLGILSIGLICVPISILLWPQRGTALLRGTGTGDAGPGWLVVLSEVGFPLMLLAGLALRQLPKR